MEVLRPGQLVRSLAGRDKGEFFLVLTVEARTAYLVNGRNRPVARPKKKNIVHLQQYERVANIEEALRTGKLTDSQVIRLIKELAPKEDVLD